MRILVSLVLLAACGHAAPTATPSAPPAPPAELRIPAIDPYRGERMFLGDRIYVIGQSEQRIAYLTEPADEACGCYTPEIVVQDLRTDEDVWKDSYDSGELDPANPDQLHDLAELWRARGADWERHIVEHGVTPGPVPALAMIPTGGTDSPHVEIHTEQVGDDSDVGYAHLTGYRIDVVRDGEATTIATNGDETFNLLSVSVDGYLPGTDYAAVLVDEDHRGWEGPPDPIRLRFVAAELPDL